MDYNVTILIPRILELAKKSPNRQIKVASSEFLHSIILYIIGDSMNNSKSIHSNILKELFTGLLELSVDSENISKQLFKPLSMELIHWFSCGRGNEEDGIILIDCISEIMGNKHNSALRNFGSIAYSEFLRWSIKQRSLNNNKNNTFESLLKRLLLLCTHSDPYKRLGAVGTLSLIYKVYREELLLIDLYILEIIMTLLLSLRLSHLDMNGMETNKKCIESINHYKKIILRKEVMNILKLINKDRSKYINGIKDIIPIILEGVSSGETDYRRQCIDLFTQIEPNSKQYILNYINNNGIKSFKNLIEGDILLPIDISTVTYKNVEEWLSRFGGILDCYQWIIQFDLCNLLVLLNPSMNELNSSNKRNYNGNIINKNEGCSVLQYCKLFISMFPSDKLNILDYFQSWSPNQLDNIGKLRAECFRRLFGFLSSIIASYPNIDLHDIIDDELLNDTWNSLVYPKALGFLEFWNDSNTPLLASAHIFLQTLIQSTYNLQTKYFFIDKIENTLPKICEWKLDNLPDSLFSCNRIIKGIISLGKIGLLNDIDNIKDYGSKIAVKVFSLPKNYSDETYSFIGDLLEVYILIL